MSLRRPREAGELRFARLSGSPFFLGERLRGAKARCDEIGDVPLYQREIAGVGDADARGFHRDNAKYLTLRLNQPSDQIWQENFGLGGGFPSFAHCRIQVTPHALLESPEVHGYRR